VGDVVPEIVNVGEVVVIPRGNAAPGTPVTMAVLQSRNKLAASRTTV
jgi:hypothetical protein